MLTELQEKVAAQVIAEESRERRHLVLALSGSHVYGFPSPDSDLDLKAAHIEPTASLLGLSVPKTSANRLEVVNGVEIDYTSNEIHGVLTGILQGNGNYAERILGPLRLVDTPENRELAPLVQGALTKKLHRHYLGFATSQYKAVEERESVTAKKVLYVLRTALTGAHVLLSGALVPDMTELLDEYGYGSARELIEAKRSGERAPLSIETTARWKNELVRAFSLLDDAYARSPLPDEAKNRAALEEWLLSLRKKLF